MDNPLLTQELLQRIQELESSHTHLEYVISKLNISDAHKSIPRQRLPAPSRWQRGGGGGIQDSSATWEMGSSSLPPSSPLWRENRISRSISPAAAVGTAGGCGSLESAAFSFTDKHFFSVLDSMGQAVHLYDFKGILIYWNRAAELLYGYSAAEALGCHVIYLLTDTRDHAAGETIVTRVTNGETWTGQFPIMTKSGERFLVIATNTPFFDDNGIQVGMVTVSFDTRPFEAVRTEIKAATRCSETVSASAHSRSTASARPGLNPQQPLQVTVASRISVLASELGNKMKSILRIGEHVMDESQNRDCSDENIANTSSSHNMEDSRSAVTGRELRFHEIITSKAEAWIHKKGISWSWKGSEHAGVEVKTITSFASPSSYNDHVNDSGHENSLIDLKPESQVGMRSFPNNNEASQSGSGSGSWSPSINADSSGSASSLSVDTKVGTDSNNLDHDILWEELPLG